MKTEYRYIVFFYLLLPLVMVLCADCGVSCAEKRYMIKFATVAPEGSAWVKCMRDLDKRLRAKSNDRIGFRIYAGGIAGDELDVLKKIRIGQLHCSAFSGVGITEILPSWRVLDLPFLFRTRQEINGVHKELENLFAGEFKKKGFEYLSWAEVGDVHLFSKKEIKVRSDLRGLKIWTWSGDPVSKATFTVMGSTPIPLSITDVTTAINTNMIDTVYAPPIGALAMQWTMGMRYMTALPLTHSTGAILVSGSYFDRIPEDLSGLLKEEVKHSMEKLSEELYRQTEESVEIIKNSGLTVIPAPEGNVLDRFYEIYDRVSKDLTGVVYSEELLERVRSILRKIRNSQ